MGNVAEADHILRAVGGLQGFVEAALLREFLELFERPRPQVLGHVLAVKGENFSGSRLVSNANEEGTRRRANHPWRF